MHRPIPYKWELIVLLWFAFFLNQADRQIYNNLLPLIQKDLGLSSTQIGLVASIFTLIYGLMVPVGGYIGDVLHRKWVVVGALSFWSVATLCTGVSTGLFALILFRGLTGGGEAYYYPSANSLIGQFHHKTRALAMAIHQTAVYIGIVVSFAAGYVGEMCGWRIAFFLFGGFGAFIALLIAFRVEDTPQEMAIGEQKAKGPSVMEVLRAVRKKPTMLFLCIAFACHVYVNVGYLTWMPTFLYEKYGLSLPLAGFSALFYHHLFAVLGVILAGKFSDHWASKRRTIRMECECVGLLVSVPFIVVIGLSQSLFWCLVATAVYGFFRGVYDSNLFVALFDVIEPRLRSSAVGIMLCFAFVTGALAPVLLGAMKQPFGMSASIAMLGGVYALGGAAILVALFTTFARDYYQESIEEPK
jgi:MFS family permease